MPLAKIYEVKIQLGGVNKPPIWRKVQIKSSISLAKLHQVIQGAMGWHNAHLHEFNYNGERYELPSPFGDDWSDAKDSRKYKVNSFLKDVKDRISYLYDFGDGWEHVITLEKILTADKNVKYPTIIKGKGMCPPEDCGGPWGYMEFRDAVNDPKHEQYEDFREWLGIEEDEYWDANYFDIKEQQVFLNSHIR